MITYCEKADLANDIYYESLIYWNSIQKDMKTFKLASLNICHRYIFSEADKKFFPFNRWAPNVLKTVTLAFALIRQLFQLFGLNLPLFEVYQIQSNILFYQVIIKFALI